MAQNPFRQRLIAAGASPMKANQFIEQRAFETGKPVGFTGKPKGPSEWYNENYAGASESLYPQGFRPPTVDAPDFKNYFDIVYGKGAYDTFTTKTLSTKAPTFRAASLSSNEFDKGIVALVKGGKSLTEITDKVVKNPAAWAGRTMSDAVSYATKLFNEYNDAQGALATAYQTQLDKNRDYKYRLPDPKLRYGTSTNLSAGTVDILSNAGAAKAYNAYATKVKDPAKLAQFKSYLVSEATKAKLTPWKDEARRRDALKGTKIGG
jgi:hypothetical protein